MSRYGDYETAAPRRRGGYGAYNDGDERPPARGRAPPRDDPYSSVRPLPPRVPASSVYDTYRPPNLHGNSGAGGGNGGGNRDRDRGRDEYSRGGRDPAPREDYRRDEYGRRDPPARGGGSAYDTYRPTSRDPPRSREPPRDPYRTQVGGGRQYNNHRDDRQNDQYGTVYPRRTPPANDYGAYDTYRPPTKPSAEYERKLEKYAGVPAPRDRRRDKRRTKRRDDTESDTDTDDESPVRSSKRSSSKKKKEKLKKKKKSKRRDDTDSEESEGEESSEEESSEESSSEKESRKKKSKKSKSKKKSSKKSKKSKKKSKDSDSEESSSEEESEDDVVNAVARNFNAPLALPAPDPAALGNEAFGFPGANTTGGNDLMGGEVTSTAMVPVNAEEFQNMPGEYPQDMSTATSAGTLAGRFPQIGSAMTPGMGMQPGMMGMQPGMMGMQPGMMGGMRGMGGLGMQQPQAGMMGGMGMGQQPGMMGAQGGMGMMGGMQGMQPGMQPGMMGGMGMQQPGMGGGAPDMLTQDFNGMNLNGNQQQ